MSESKNISDSTSQPSTEDPTIGGPSSEGAEIAKIVSTADPNDVVPPVHSALDNPALIPNQTDRTFELAGNSGTIKMGDLHSAIRLLDVDSTNSKKCSYEDILFLVMVILEESAADQRNSRFNEMITKIKVADKAASSVFEMKIKEADATYKASKKTACMKIATGIVNIVTSGLSGVAGGLSTGKILGTVVKIIKLVVTIINFVMSVVSFSMSITTANLRHEASITNADAKRAEKFFEFTLSHVKEMQEAYSTSKKNVQTIMDTIREVIQREYASKSGISKNI
ncbi:MAG: hypothetical protein LBR91_01910 [Puniceicoccales bacterium]|jgi:hypothetical protein|nr:hypothetical protein [Puniceicoccales bacterium]